MTHSKLRRAGLPRLCLLILASLVAAFPAWAVNRCVVNGQTTFQDAPCPVTQPRRDPTLAELNAAEKLRRAAAASAALAAPKQPVHPPAMAPGLAPATAPTPAPAATTGGFRCDGRQYCSQMHSCAEAQYFLTHCPDVKMDGDHNGIPCEKQWCGR
jgi:Excalibur calcium-binding domain